MLPNKPMELAGRGGSRYMFPSGLRLPPPAPQLIAKTLGSLIGPSMTGWRVVRKGVWLYDQTVPSGVWIIEADYDFWYELDKADGQLEPSEGPELNAAGHRYYAVFRSPPLAGPFWAETGGADTVEEACRQAQLKVPNTIRWEA